MPIHEGKKQIQPQDGSSWLNHPSGLNDDPWIFRSNDDSSKHAAFIGNGLIGCRIGEDGNALHTIDGSGSLMAGFWGACRRKPERPEGQVDLPRWAGFSLFIGDQREVIRLADREQMLDTQRAQVTTTGRIGPVAIQRTSWLARADKHLAVFSATLTNTNADGRPIKIECREEFDSSDLHAFDIQSINAHESGFSVAGVEQRLGIELAVASRCTWKIDDAQRVKVQDLKRSESGVRRSQYVWIKAGETLTLTRYVALARSGHATDLVEFVQQEVERAVHDPQGLLNRHLREWSDIWQHWIEVDHQRLQRVLNAGLYYMYASVRADEEWSHGPAGLTNDAWDGTVFWDTELWTFPPLAMLQPGMAMACARYRLNTLEGARANAREHGEQGARFAWQSAASGLECCVRPIFTEERHIVSCVARGQWLAAVASGDQAYRHGSAWEVISSCADYWVSRIETDSDGSAHIRQVCGPDEDAGLVDDNAMTNVSAGWTLRLAHRLAEEQGKLPHPQWLTLAEALVVPWDNERDIPLQMAGWTHGQTIKQADATLLVHPWRYPLSNEKKTALVDYYRAHYPPNQIMMGVAIDAIVDCQVGRGETAWEALGQLMPHIHEPYLWFTEAPNNENGCFLTGIGGLLQLVLQGFAGVYIDDQEQLQIEPCLPQSLNKLTLHGLWHNGEQKTYELQRQDSERVRLSIHS